MSGLREAVEKLVEQWRYKGEFGWGPWQMGEGPDIEGQILDEAANEIRKLLAAHPEPATGVAEPAVEAAAAVIYGAELNWPQAEPSAQVREYVRKKARAALEAAQPFLGVRPVVDREAVREVLARQFFRWDEDRSDASLDELSGGDRDAYRTTAEGFTDAIVRLLNGEGSETTRAVVQSENK